MCTTLKEETEWSIQWVSLSRKPWHPICTLNPETWQERKVEIHSVCSWSWGTCDVFFLSELEGETLLGKLHGSNGNFLLSQPTIAPKKHRESLWKKHIFLKELSCRSTCSPARHSHFRPKLFAFGNLVARIIIITIDCISIPGSQNGIKC